MLKNTSASHCTATIQNLSHEGRGVTKMNGKTLFIDNALSGEEVTFNYLKKYSKYDEGIAQEIKNPSSDRVQPQCAHFLVCGGCSLQHMGESAQIELKQSVLLEQLQHFAGLVPETLLPPLTGPTYGYRRKARLGVRFVVKKNQVLVGFHEKNGRYIADISSCPILDPAVSHLIEPLKACVAQLTAYRHIAQIEVACGDDEKAFIFRHLEPLSEEDKALLVTWGKEYNTHIHQGRPGSRAL
jgi:23S rRNA (uracil1939-C5)-methyltransferase